MNQSNQAILNRIKGGLVVSCQALKEEPLYSSYIMSRMAYAAMLGGAVGIRANTIADITEIKKTVSLPIIGIIKEVYGDCDVYITPTMKEVDALVECGVSIIAADATDSDKRPRPDGKSLDEFFGEVREKYPDQPLMADCSTYEEAIHADELGFDFIGTTLVGYTDQSKDMKIEQNDFELIKEIVKNVKHNVIAEGNINTPEKVKRVMQLGVFSIVVGSAITRPQLITKAFVDALK